MVSEAADTQVRSRPPTAQEEIYWRLTYTDQIHPVLAAEVKGRSNVSQWRAALDSVQRRHPLLQVGIEMPGVGKDNWQPVFVPRSSERIPLRVELRDADETAIAAEIQHELATPFVSGMAPLARALLLHAPERSVFVLAISHSIADGMSALIFIRDVLAVLSGKSLEPLPMPASAEELLGLPPVSPDAVASDADDRIKNGGREPTVLLKTLSENATKALIATARAHNSTVHAALTAAFVSALRQLVPRFKTDAVRIISPVSTRNELGFGDALGMYFASPQSSFEANESATFWDMAAKARAEIAAKSSRPALLEATAAMRGLTQPGLSNEGVASILQHAFAMDLLLSNLGRVPYHLAFGDLVLERVWGPAVLAGENTHAVGVLTTGDQLCLTLTSRRPVPHLLETAIDVLTSEIDANPGQSR